jgi:FixJ family two-component response regulator
MAVKFTILLVDDDLDVVDILRRASVQCFPEAIFIPVTDFNEASKYLSDLDGLGPNLVLLDIHLQVEPNGLTFLSLMREHPIGRLVPIIVLTTAVDRLFSIESYKRGANAFTIKPSSYEGWKKYVEQLRLFWLQTATLPRPYFTQE